MLSRFTLVGSFWNRPTAYICFLLAVVFESSGFKASVNTSLPASVAKERNRCVGKLKCDAVGLVAQRGAT